MLFSSGLCGALLILALSVTSPGAAQEHPKASAPRHVRVPSIPARSGDVRTIDGIIKAYYEVVSGPAGQSRQWARDRTLYAPGIRFVVIDEDKDGKAVAQVFSHQQFVDFADPELVKKGFYEREVHRATHRFGNTVHVFSTSESRRTPEGPILEHRLDSLELFWDGKRWWIVTANLWPKERPDNPLPKEFLP